MIKKFRKLPVVIEAIFYLGTPESNREIIDWTRGSKTPASMDTFIGIDDDGAENHSEEPRLTIATLEGAHWVSPP